MRPPVLTGGDWEGQGWEVGVRTKGPAHRPRWPPRAQATAGILCSRCRRKGEERRAGRVGAEAVPLPARPAYRVPSPGRSGARRAAPALTVAVPGTQTPTPLWSGQGPGPAYLGECAWRRGGRKGGPGSPKSRYWSWWGAGWGSGTHPGTQAPPYSCYPEGVVTVRPLHSSRQPSQFLGLEPPDCAPRLLQRQEVGAEEKAESDHFRTETGRQDGVLRDPSFGSVYGVGRAPLLADSGSTCEQKVLQAAELPSQGAGPRRRAVAHHLPIWLSASVSSRISSAFPTWGRGFVLEGRGT